MTSDTRLDDFVTVRDWLRAATSAFNSAKLSFGHGTATAQDDAAFIILSALDLPIDVLEPWLDCRLTLDERGRIAALIDARVSTRKPAPYLINRAYIQGRSFYVDERVIVPRSFIGELLCLDRLASVIGDGTEAAISSVLDLCTGSGCLAILAAEMYPGATVDAADISPDALQVAARNIDDYGLADRVFPIQSDLFSALDGRRYDLIISNPPYVTQAAVAAFPAEYRAEPILAHVSGRDGLDHVRRILSDAHQHMTADATLIVEIGQTRDALEAAYPTLPFLWLDTAESEGEVFALQTRDLI